MTKKIAELLGKYAEAAKWEHRCRMAYEAVLDADFPGADDAADAREQETFSVFTQAEVDKMDALHDLTVALLEEP